MSVLRGVAVAFALLLVYPSVSFASNKVCGEASWYGNESGTTTYTGEHFYPDHLSAAMPWKSWIGRTVTVENMRTHKKLRLRINDYGPAAWTHRVIDLSRGAARALGINGLGQVCVYP